mmetsp:Transcript_10639/g.26024  ORF Transcript_10639/g.26024 Transcript_10639/m.26024 type:complete len:262 (-) Transcript_10639:1266-2051(-)
MRGRRRCGHHNIVAVFQAQLLFIFYLPPVRLLAASPPFLLGVHHPVVLTLFVRVDYVVLQVHCQGDGLRRMQKVSGPSTTSRRRRTVLLFFFFVVLFPAAPPVAVQKALHAGTGTRVTESRRERLLHIHRVGREPARRRLIGIGATLMLILSLCSGSGRSRRTTVRGRDEEAGKERHGVHYRRMTDGLFVPMTVLPPFFRVRVIFISRRRRRRKHRQQVAAGPILLLEESPRGRDLLEGCAREAARFCHLSRHLRWCAARR